jgi:hypothetical protein
VTAYRFVTLTCDECGEVSDGGMDLSVKAARATARAEHWTYEGRRDICPRHHGYYWCDVGGWIYDPAIASRFNAAAPWTA